jgi:hypothetical protein
LAARVTLTTVLAVVLAPLAACAPAAPPADGPSGAPAPALTTFGSDEAFARFQQQMERDWQARIRKRPPYGTHPRPPEPTPLGHPPPRGEPVEADAPGVHHPGIVKATRDHLVVLRRGRLHTIRIADGALDTVAGVSAIAPGTPPGEAGVGSILVSGDVVAVVGSGARGLALQVGLFRISPDGGLAHQGTYQFRNGGSDSARMLRMVDGRLVLYAPIGVWNGDPRGIEPYLPAVRRREPGSADTAWTPLVRPAGIYRPAGRMRVDDGTSLHGVTVCDAAGGALDCRATVVFAPRDIASHVSRTAAYVWTTQWAGYDETDVPSRSVLYRIPLDGGAPTAIGVDGQPHGEEAFEETSDGELHVLQSGGRTPLDRESAGYTPVALLRIPLAAFGDGSGKLGAEAYRWFPNPGSTTFHGRFVGDWIVYGAEAETGSWGDFDKGRAFAVRRDGTGEPVPLPLPRGQYDGLLGFGPLGGGVVVVGESLDSLHYVPVRLGARAEPGRPFARPEEHAWEVEAHAEFYHPLGDGGGVLALARSGFVYTPSVLYLRHDTAGLRPAGELASTVPPGTECPMCGGSFDYAYPLFLRGRVLAVLGGEIVEGRMEGDAVREMRRIRFAPPALSED